MDNIYDKIVASGVEPEKRLTAVVWYWIGRFAEQTAQMRNAIEKKQHADSAAREARKKELACWALRPKRQAPRSRAARQATR